jgi:hypothetical protein
MTYSYQWYLNIICLKTHYCSELKKRPHQIISQKDARHDLVVHSNIHLVVHAEVLKVHPEHAIICCHEIQGPGNLPGIQGEFTPTH